VRKIFLVTSAAFVLNMAALPASADMVDTFKSICLAHLDDPAGVQKAARSAGFKGGLLAEVMGKDAYIAFHDETAETVMLNVATPHEFDCAITSPDLPGPEKLRQTFFASLGIKTGKSMVKAKVGGKQYTFKFDTYDGEALVVYR
jgi:hypothetical protein